MFWSRSSTFHSFPPHNHTRGMHSFLNAVYHLFQLLVCKSDFVFAVQPMKLGEHLNSLLLNMCDDVTLSRISLRTVLDICSKHIRNSTCDPPFSYIRKLVRLVLGSLSQVCSPPPWRSSIRAFLPFLFLARADSYVISVFSAVCVPSCFSPLFLISFYFSLPFFSQLDGLLTDRESLPERSKEIRERLRGKGLPSGKRGSFDTFCHSSGWRTRLSLMRCVMIMVSFRLCYSESICHHYQAVNKISILKPSLVSECVGRAAVFNWAYFRKMWSTFPVVSKKTAAFFQSVSRNIASLPRLCNRGMALIKDA